MTLNPQQPFMDEVNRLENRAMKVSFGFLILCTGGLVGLTLLTPPKEVFYTCVVIIVITGAVAFFYSLRTSSRADKIRKQIRI